MNPRDERFKGNDSALSTFYTYKGDINRHVLPTLRNTPLVELTTEDIDELIGALERKGKAPETIRNVFVPLRKMLGEAVRQRLLAANPASLADLPPAQEFRGKDIPPEHLRAIRKALGAGVSADALRDGEPDLLWARAFNVALDGPSLRRVAGALLARRRPGALADRQRARILGPRAHAAEERGGYPRRPNIPADASGACRTWRARHRPPAVRPGRPRVPDGARGVRLAVELLPPRLEARAQEGEARRPWVSLARPQHTCVSRLVSARADFALVRAVAGHADSRITLERYTQLREQRVSEAANPFAAAFSLPAD